MSVAVEPTNRASAAGNRPAGPSEFAIDLGWKSDTRGPVRWILSHVRRHWGVVIAMLVGALGNALLAASIPIFIGQGFDAILNQGGDMGLLLTATFFLLGSQLIRSILQLFRNFGAEVLGQRLERDTRQELYAALLGKNMAFHDLNSTGEVMARATNDVRELALMMAPGINLVIGSGIFLFMPIIAAPRFHPTLVLVPSVFMVAYLIAMVFYLRALGPVTTAVRTSFGQMNSGLTAAIEGIETVKGAAREESEIERFLQGAGAVRHASIEQGKVEAQFLPLLLIGLAEGAAFWHALVLFQQGLLTTGDVVAYMGLIALFGFPVFTSLFAYSQVASGVSSARRILELVNARVDLDENEQGHAKPMKGSVRFEWVTFHYRSDETGLARPALQDVSFAIEAGQTLALVGQTGSGKSTVAKLMNRIYDINGGRVLVDGIDVRDWRLATLRQQISIIEQDIFLFSRSIAENIAFGNGSATQEEIEAAARAAQAHEFILSFPEGYRTVIGERGVTLSGGQRQRLALARAFLTNPAILILDDSTSAIDSATEDQIQRAIEAASAGRTTILITHRLSQIRWADKIVVLRKGRVVAAGTHDELMASSQAYRDIFARI